MRSVGREGRSIDLRMIFVEYPVRVIHVAVLVATALQQKKCIFISVKRNTEFWSKVNWLVT